MGQLAQVHVVLGRQIRLKKGVKTWYALQLLITTLSSLIHHPILPSPTFPHTGWPAPAELPINYCAKRLCSFCQCSGTACCWSVLYGCFAATSPSGTCAPLVGQLITIRQLQFYMSCTESTQSIMILWIKVDFTHHLRFEWTTSCCFSFYL